MTDTVKVTAKKYHTHQGKEHHEGDAYNVDSADVENLVAIGMVAAPAAAAPAAKKSQPVEPMTTESFGATPKPAAKPATKPAANPSRVTTGPKK